MTRIDARFDHIDRQFDRVWDEFRDLRGEIAAVARQLSQIGWALVAVLLVQMIAAVVVLSL